MGIFRVPAIVSGYLQDFKWCHGEGKENIQVKTGDSISCTSLSTWTSIGTVISRSALRKVNVRLKDTKAVYEVPHKIWSKFEACSYAWASKHKEKTETALWHHDRYNVVNKACPSCCKIINKLDPWNVNHDATYSCLETLQTFAEIGELRRCDENDIQFLHDDTCEFQVLTIIMRTFGCWSRKSYSHLLSR